MVCAFLGKGYKSIAAPFAAAAAAAHRHLVRTTFFFNIIASVTWHFFGLFFGVHLCLLCLCIPAFAGQEKRKSREETTGHDFNGYAPVLECVEYVWRVFVCVCLVCRHEWSVFEPA